MNNNIIVNMDTDSVMITKPDGSIWSDEEQQAFLDALNAEFPEKIKFAHDGYYDVVAVFGSKNYALLPNIKHCKSKDLDKDGKPMVKLKGSSIKSATKEIALKEMMTKIIGVLLETDE